MGSFPKNSGQLLFSLQAPASAPLPAQSQMADSQGKRRAAEVQVIFANIQQRRTDISFRTGVRSDRQVDLFQRDTYADVFQDS